MEIKCIIDIIVSYAFPLIAVVISIFSFLESRKVNKIQLRLNEMEVILKKYELEEKEKEREVANKSIVEARILHVSKGKYRLKIWNSGQTTAFNVDYVVPENLKGLLGREKVPFEILEAGKNFEEYIIHYMGMPPKISLKTTWEDSNGEQHEKEQWVTF